MDVNGTSPAVVTDPSLMTDLQLESAIVAEQQRLGGASNPLPKINAPEGQAINQTPGQAQPGQVPQVPTTEQTAAAQTQAQNEPQYDNLTFEQLQDKSGVKSPDELARSYAELRRSFDQKAQENAELKRQQALGQQPVQQPYSQPQPPINDIDRMNEAFVGDLQRNPLGTIAQIVKAMTAHENKPFIESQKEIALKSEIARLKSSPNTSTFNLPEVQDEITKVLQENPDYMDNLPRNLEMVHERALGRIAMRSKVNVGTQVQGQTPSAFVEGKNRPSQPQAFDPQTSSLDDLKRVIQQLQRQI